jgi:hypothetical protein
MADDGDADARITVRLRGDGDSEEVVTAQRSKLVEVVALIAGAIRFRDEASNNTTGEQQEDVLDVQTGEPQTSSRYNFHHATHMLAATTGAVWRCGLSHCIEVGRGCRARAGVGCRTV